MSFNEIYMNICCTRTLAGLAFDLVNEKDMSDDENKEKLYDLLHMLSETTKKMPEAFEAISELGTFL